MALLTIVALAGERVVAAALLYLLEWLHKRAYQLTGLSFLDQYNPAQSSSRVVIGFRKAQPKIRPAVSAFSV